jgi:hypothetical protein
MKKLRKYIEGKIYFVKTVRCGRTPSCPQMTGFFSSKGDFNVKIRDENSPRIRGFPPF